MTLRYVADDTLSAPFAPWLTPFGFFDGTVNVRMANAPVDLFDSWVSVPQFEGRAVPQAQALASMIRSATGWSKRTLAKALASTHPTVTAIEKGRSSGRQGDLLTRLNEVHDVVTRVHLLAERDIHATDRLLTTPSVEGLAPIDFLALREPGTAYLAVLDVMRPRRADSLMVSRWPSLAGGATSALESEDV